MSSPATMQEEDALSRTFDAHLMRRLLSYVRPYRALVLASVALLMIEGALQLVGPILTQKVIDVAIPSRDTELLLAMVIVFAATLVAQFVCSFGEAMLTNLLGQSVMRDLRMQIFSHLQRLSVSFFDRNPAGRLITRVTADVETLNELFTAGVVSGLGDLFTLVAIGVAMIFLDWRLSLAAMVVIPLIALVSHWFRSTVREAYREIRIRLARINSFLQERITGIRVVQLFGREESEIERFRKLNADHRDSHIRSITAYAVYFPAVEFLTSVAMAILIVASASLVSVNSLTVGTVAAFLQLGRRFYQPLQDLAEKFNILQSAMASSERIFALLDTEPGHGSDPTRPTRRKTEPVEVRFEDVWFAYAVGHVAGTPRDEPTEPEWVLRGVSFEVRQGSSVALVGHTGAGKTTIVNLLMRFYEPQRGRILVNGRDARTIPIDELRGLIAYVQQDIFLFAGDVATNIRLANPLTDAEVAAAAGRVGADRIIRRLPLGYAHVLGERGASLSVGERQLLSFARAVAADASLLILDEATSAVDSEIEAEIQRGLAVMMEGRTTIAIAHRLSTIVGSDEILVLHHGEIVERGRHAELMGRAGLYERLWRLQAGELTGEGDEP